MMKVAALTIKVPSPVNVCIVFAPEVDTVPPAAA
jgi:hypothetical protein